jgi:hypothetical protein
MLSGIGAEETTNNDIQHAVWAQFDPGNYGDTGVLATFSSEHPPIDPTRFGLVVDANYAIGNHLEQAFLVDPQQPALQQFFVTDPQSPAPEPASLMEGVLR